MRTTLISTRALLLVTVAASIAAGCSSSSPARTDAGTGGTSTGGAGGTQGGAGSGGSVGSGGSGGTGGTPVDGGADSAIGNAFVYFVKQANGTTTATLAGGTFSVNSSLCARRATRFKYVAPNYYGTVSNGFISFPTPMTGDFSITAEVTVTTQNKANNACGIGRRHHHRVRRDRRLRLHADAQLEQLHQRLLRQRAPARSRRARPRLPSPTERRCS